MSVIERGITSGGPPIVAIIGGGFTGAAVAWHLARSGAFAPGSITVYEPRAALGMGLAYDTDDPAHRINVPASRMSLMSSDPLAFERWYRDEGRPAGDPEAFAADGHAYPRRKAFGAYVASRLSPLVATGLIRHVRRPVTGLQRDGEAWRLTDDHGDSLLADAVVIATSHPPPRAPASLDRALAGHPRYIPDATRPGALAAIRPHDRVLVVGNGLTSADVIASLGLSGHVGPVTAISRRGLTSRGHARAAQDPWGDFSSRPARSARLLVKRIREAIDAASVFDVSWHAVLDAVRAQGQSIWAELPEAERRRVVRHLRPFWDVHRFRIAPQVEAALLAAERAGRLRRIAARLGPVLIEGEAIRAALKKRDGTVEFLDADAVVVTTGPGHGAIIEAQAFLAELAEAGLAHLDPTGLGLACDRRARLLGSDGAVVTGLYLAGPLARGTFGELMGLPQVADHAEAVAGEVGAFMADRSRHPVPQSAA